MDETFQANTLYATDSYVVSFAVNQNGTGFLSGHADGSIVRWYIADDASARAQVRVLATRFFFDTVLKKKIRLIAFFLTV